MKTNNKHSQSVAGDSNMKSKMAKVEPVFYDETRSSDLQMRNGLLECEIKAGDLVVLKSGGPDLTVAQVNRSAKVIKVAWLVGDEVNIKSVPLEVLYKYISIETVNASDSSYSCISGGEEECYINEDNDYLHEYSGPNGEYNRMVDIGFTNPYEYELWKESR